MAPLAWCAANRPARVACGACRHRNKLHARDKPTRAEPPIVGVGMRQQLTFAATAVLLGLTAHAATAQEKIKIGVIVTTSGPPAALGAQVRDGFALAVKDLGGKMGGREVEIVNVDDELKPDSAVVKVKGLLERENVDFVVGPIFSNILQ